VLCIFIGSFLVQAFYPYAFSNTISYHIPFGSGEAVVERPQTLLESILFKFLVVVGILLIVFAFIDVAIDEYSRRKVLRGRNNE
jgi:flagellar biosynthesis protein FlhB